MCLCLISIRSAYTFAKKHGLPQIFQYLNVSMFFYNVIPRKFNFVTNLQQVLLDLGCIKDCIDNLFFALTITCLAVLFTSYCIAYTVLCIYQLCQRPYTKNHYHDMFCSALFCSALWNVLYTLLWKRDLNRAHSSFLNPIKALLMRTIFSNTYRDYSHK